MREPTKGRSLTFDLIFDANLIYHIQTHYNMKQIKLLFIDININQ
jgi:hypothetical protein